MKSWLWVALGVAAVAGLLMLSGLVDLQALLRGPRTGAEDIQYFPDLAIREGDEKLAEDDRHSAENPRNDAESIERSGFHLSLHGLDPGIRKQPFYSLVAPAERSWHT